MDGNDKTHLKQSMLVELERALGIVTQAAQKIGITRQTHYNWYNTDPEYRAAVDDISNVCLDFAESQLLTQMKDGNTSATIFYLKTKGKHRGYVERTELTGADGAPVQAMIDPRRLSKEALLEIVQAHDRAGDGPHTD